MAVVVQGRSAHRGFEVAVVGAGCAGLSAAVRLARGGARVVVVEARSRLGGRATAFVDRESREVVDNGQHVLLGCYRETLEFLAEIGASDLLRRQPALRVTMVDRRGRRTTLSCPNLPSPLHLIAGVMDWEALDWRDRLAILRMAGPLRLARRQFRREIESGAALPSSRQQPGDGPIAASPGETVDNWLIRNGQTDRLRELLWEPLALAALNQPIAHAAAPVFARVLAEVFGPDPRAAAILLPTVPLDQFYAEPARRYIEQQGGEVRTGCTATIALDGGAATLHVSGDSVPCQSIVAAVPWFALGDLFTGDTSPIDSVLARTRLLVPSPILTVNLWFERPVMDEAFIGLPGRPFQWVFDKGALLADGARHLSLVSSGESQLGALDNEQLVARATADLQDALPEARHARLLRGTVIREPRATFSLAPGQPDRPGTRTEIANLYLAGDWTDTGLPATIEGAVRSGHAAAAAVAARAASGLR